MARKEVQSVRPSFWRWRALVESMETDVFGNLIRARSKFDDESIVFNLSHATIGTADGNNEIPFFISSINMNDFGFFFADES